MSSKGNVDSQIVLNIFYLGIKFVLILFNCLVKCFNVTFHKCNLQTFSKIGCKKNQRSTTALYNCTDIIL